VRSDEPRRAGDERARHSGLERKGRNVDALLAALPLRV
jgi:hypothetical protein